MKQQRAADANKAKVVERSLCPEQRHGLWLALHTQANMFITGDAGTGKSYLLHAIIAALEARGEPGLYVTASTGIAANDLPRGRTVHAWGGLGLADRPTAVLIYEMTKKGAAVGAKLAAARWRRARVLVVDEVSMLDATFLEYMDTMARALRQCPKPMGGIRLIVVGDFFQLGPVAKPPKVQTFAFESPVWAALQFRPVVLHYAHRQSVDKDFGALLREVRWGRVTPDVVAALHTRVGPAQPPTATSLVTTIMPHHADVESINRNRLHQLKDETRRFVATDWVCDERHRSFFKDLRAPAILDLKVGAQVMLVRNTDLVVNDEAVYLPNGALGRVTGFTEERRLLTGDLELDSTPDEQGVWVQFVGVPAPVLIMPTDWSRYEDQMRATSPKVSVVVEKRPAKRARILEIGEDGAIHEVAFVQTSTARKKKHGKTPWKGTGDGEGEEEEEDEPRVLLAQRTQIPLMLAYALTGHKSQGQTITGPVQTDLSRVFEAGHAYVILSRVRSMEQLTLTGLDPDKIRANPKVVAFYQSLAGGEGDPHAAARAEAEALLEEASSNMDV